MANSSEEMMAYIAEHLPVARAMDVAVKSYDGDTLVVAAPLLANINDKQTAFGGSLYNMAMMACWGLLHLKIQEFELDCDQAITKGEVTYKRAVHGELVAACTGPSAEQWDEVIKSFREFGKVKIKMQSVISENDQEAVVFDGEFVLLKWRKKAG